MQPGPIYFKTPQERGIFQVSCEGVPCQITYLLDEAATVVADNCAGQSSIEQGGL